MVLGVAALVAAGALVLYASVHANERTAEALNQMNTIQQGVRRFYGGQATFSGLTTGTLIDARIVPLAMVNGTLLRNSFGGGVVVGVFDQGGITAGGFEVTFNGVPADSCVTLSTKDYGRALAQLVVNTTTFDYETDGVLPTASDANLACGTTNDAVVSWRFKN